MTYMHKAHDKGILFIYCFEKYDVVKQLKLTKQIMTYKTSKHYMYVVTVAILRAASIQLRCERGANKKKGLGLYCAASIARDVLRS